MTSEYYCECCNYDAKDKHKLLRHQKTKKHLKNSLGDDYVPQPVVKQFECEKCHKMFALQKSLKRHLKESCDVMIKEKLQKEVDLLNNANSNDNTQLDQAFKNFNKHFGQTNMNNDNTIVNVNNSVQVNNYDFFCIFFKDEEERNHIMQYPAIIADMIQKHVVFNLDKFEMYAPPDCNRLTVQIWPPEELKGKYMKNPDSCKKVDPKLLEE
jgi:hypothetical protein